MEDERVTGLERLDVRTQRDSSGVLDERHGNAGSSRRAGKTSGTEWDRERGREPETDVRVAGVLPAATIYILDEGAR